MPAFDLVVAPDGSDDAPGTLEQPLATLDGARRAVREQPKRQTPIVVAVRGGVYWLDDTVTFAAADAPAIYTAFERETPILSAGQRLDDWRINEHGYWVTRLADVAAGHWWFRSLWVDDQRRYRCRLPRDGYLSIADGLEPSEHAAGFSAQRGGSDRFRFWADEIPTDMGELSDIDVLAIHNWMASRFTIAEVDRRAQVLRVTGRTWHEDDHGNFARGRRYLLENVRDSLGAPGQWHLCRATGELTYVPHDGESPDSANVIAPRLDRAVHLAGTPGAPVEHLHLRGLCFAHNNWTMPDAGHSTPQSEVDVGAIVGGEYAQNIRIESCVVRHTSTYGIELGDGCSDCAIERCTLIDLGAGGVRIGSRRMIETDPDQVEPDPAEVASRITVRQCRIAHGGRLHPAGCGVWIGHAHHNAVTHNTIEDFYYSGVSVGWVWGYAPSYCHHNEIACNRIGPLGHGVLSDMGGTYTLGRQPGTRIHHNVIHDVTCYDYGGWGLYFDEGSTDILADHNLVCRTTDGSVTIHYGRNVRVENNILVDAREKQLRRNRRTNVISHIELRRNIVFWHRGALHGEGWQGHGFVCDQNLFWNPTVEPEQLRFGATGELTFAQWRTFGQDLESTIADPGFVDAEHDDYRLRPDSPALALGFEPWDYDEAGATDAAPLSIPPVPHAMPRRPELDR